MSFQKPEKDFGEGPVRSYHISIGLTETVLIAFARIEGPQDPYHSYLSQGRRPREGLLGAYRPCPLQVPAGQGSRPSAHQVPAHLHP